MPRRQRVHLDDVPLHIVQRGHNREPCFFGDEDCFTYVHWLGEALTETGGQLHAYALMTNHVHLLVIPHRVATKEWAANCDRRSTKTSPSGTSVSMRRLSAWLGSVARRDREGGRA
jgi:REP element-mobilizing transposase RayT